MLTSCIFWKSRWMKLWVFNEYSWKQCGTKRNWSLCNNRARHCPSKFISLEWPSPCSSVDSDADCQGLRVRTHTWQASFVLNQSANGLCGKKQPVIWKDFCVDYSHPEKAGKHMGTRTGRCDMWTNVENGVKPISEKNVWVDHEQTIHRHRLI